MRFNKNRDLLETGEIYHIFNRGVNRQNIFPDDEAYSYFLHLLGHCKKFITPLTHHRKKVETHGEEIFLLRPYDDESKPPRFRVPVELQAFVLMPNHFHLLVRQLVDGGVSLYLSRICNAFTRAFNQRFKRTGPLWEKRFAAKVVESENSYLQLIRYIHLNPFKTSPPLANDLREYRYSSYLEMAGLADKKICDLEFPLDLVGSFRNYDSFVRAQITPEEGSSLKGLTVEDWFEN
ncbi:MAG: hypothetical protein UV05_C0011G0019 [candidate division CPR1 bacterium GW2011_GWA2_42_17]|uniref:Transposase IS200-like domain-containing protein n=1 Tax=candidate division CPR1 bacterium GW2011_GWA2_42_17 TaxID=1618341 RepID=A0A0G1C3B2_9BACT|nr:MAG: hypothetical protein UV05_C0011G0019 [candidate division CPR1 bacterium GW2011_GWA2_42_17]